MDFIKTKCKQRNVNHILQNIIPSNEAQTKWGKKQKRRANNSECVRQR